MALKSLVFLISLTSAQRSLNVDLLPIDNSTLFASNVSDRCRDHFVFTLDAIEANEEWALKLNDANGKISSGFLHGRLPYYPGAFDECLRIKVDESDRKFRGQYCLIGAVSIDDNVTDKYLSLINRRLVKEILIVGRCIPSSCSELEFQSVLTTATAKAPLKMRAMTKFCQIQDDSPLNTTAILLLFVLSIFAIFLPLLNTILDYDRNKPETMSIWNDVIKSFSIANSSSAIFSTRSNSDAIECLYGIRVLSVISIIFGHSLIYSESISWSNASEVSHLRNNILATPVVNGSLIVDTFFCMSGLLLAYVFLKKMKKGIRFDALQFYIHRYARLTPPYAVMIAIYATLLPHFGSGPIWHQTFEASRNCAKNGWKNLLYISNIVGLDDFCMGHTWYLIVDMQLYLLAPLILYPLYKKPKAGFIVIALFVCLSAIIVGILIYIYDLPPIVNFLGGEHRTRLDWRRIYWQPYDKMGAFCVGIIGGYILQREKTSLRLSRKIIIFGWIVLFSSNLAILGIIHSYITHPTSWSLFFKITYGSLSRTVWSIGIVWVVFTCHSGYGGAINSFLSWRGFLPLSRLSYCAYLIHHCVLVTFLCSRKETVLYDFWSEMNLFLPTVFVSYILALPLCALLEMPVFAIQQRSLTRPCTNKELFFSR